MSAELLLALEFDECRSCPLSQGRVGLTKANVLRLEFAVGMEPISVADRDSCSGGKP